jgi:hypothetical protein
MIPNTYFPKLFLILEEMDLGEVGWDDVDRIDLAQVRNSVLNFRVP